MEPITYIIIIFGSILLYVIISLIMTKIKDNLLYDEIENFCINNKLNYSRSSDNRYDILMENDDFKMLIKICKIPTNSSVTINSKTTWCLRFGGGKRKGRNYPNKRYLNELAPFLSMNQDNDSTKSIYRLVILYPKTEIILKYLNESEITEVKPEHINYGFKVISYSDFFNDFQKLLVIDQKNRK